MYGDLESVKLLVSNGANVNQRASGRFFLPEDQKNGRTKETTYQGEGRLENYLQISLCTLATKPVFRVSDNRLKHGIGADECLTRQKIKHLIR